MASLIDKHEITDPIKSYKKAIKSAMLFMAFIFIFSLLSIDSNNYNKVFEQSELIQIKGILKEQPYIAQGKGKHLTFYLNEFPEFSFPINGWRYGAFKAEAFVNSCKAGDTIVVGIIKHDYETKIVKSAQPKLSEKIMNYHSIEPYSIEHRSTSYLTLTEVNNIFKDNLDLGNWFAWSFVVIITITIVVYIILKITGATKKLQEWFPMN